MVFSRCNWKPLGSFIRDRDGEHYRENFLGRPKMPGINVVRCSGYSIKHGRANIRNRGEL